MLACLSLAASDQCLFDVTAMQQMLPGDRTHVELERTAPAGEPAPHSRTAYPQLEAPSFLVQKKIVEQRRECRVVDGFDVEKSLGAHLSIPDRHQRDEPPREYARR